MTALLLGVCVGCGPALPPVTGAPASQASQGPTSGSGDVSTIVMEPIQVVAHTRGGQREFEVFDAAGLFEEGGGHLKAKRWDQAISTYDRLVREFPDSRYVVAALYNAGLAHEGKKDWVGAVPRFRAVADRAKKQADVIDALFHLGACFAEAENFAASAEVFGRLAERADLKPVDRVEAMVRRGFAQFKLGDIGPAERTLREAVAVYRKADAERRLDQDFFLAMAHYYLAEIPHEEFKRVPIRLPERQMERDLENKARLLLTAQGRYIATINVRNPHWATASGFQVGALYREFYDAVVGAPIPRADLRRRARAAKITYEEILKAYIDQVRQYMRPLLENAIRIHEKNLRMAERVGVDNDWVDRSNRQLESLKRLLAGAGVTPPPPATQPQRPTRQVPREQHPPRRLKREYFPRVTL